MMAEGEAESSVNEYRADNFEESNHVAIQPPPKILTTLTESIYHELSRLNGKINKYNRSELTTKLKAEGLDCHGTDDVLKKRLKNYYKKIKLSNIGEYLSKDLLPYYVVIDFEATCEEVNPPDYEHEIIEFPAVLVNSKTQKIEDTFQLYCKPTLNSKLSAFCTELTGITQEQVDNSDEFQNVLNKFQDWLSKHELGTTHKFCIVTDGPWDMSRFLYRQCLLLKIPYPKWAKNWVNVRKVFSNFYKCKRCNLKDMLEHLKIPFEGRPHCGLDDSKNIAQILIKIMCDGADLQVNERILLKNSVENKTVNKNMQGWGRWSNNNLTCLNYKSVDRKLKTVDMVKKERIALEQKTAASFKESQIEIIEQLEELNIETEPVNTSLFQHVQKKRHFRKPTKKHRKLCH